jgi:hemerythrin
VIFSPKTNRSHHALCAALRRERRALCSRAEWVATAADDDFADAFMALVSEVETAFRREEMIMDLLGSPSLRERREENATILAALHRVTAAVECGNFALGHEVVAALCSVLDLHRLTVDLAMSLAADSFTMRGYGRHTRHRV